MAVIDQLTGMIPIAVAGGMVLKFTQAAFPAPQRAKRKAKRKKVKKTSLFPYGNFSNINF